MAFCVEPIAPLTALSFFLSEERGGREQSGNALRSRGKR